MTRAGIGFGALFVVGVLLAAIPNHRPPVAAASQDASQAQGQTQQPASEGQASQGQQADHSKMPGMDMPGMNMDSDEGKSSEPGAMQDMAHMHHGDTPHMHMTAMRAQTPEDAERAEKIVAELRRGIEKYKDYHVALNEGYKIFAPNVPQPEYHFTNYTNGFLEAFTFDPSRPTSLLYKKTKDGYELVGAMYTMPKRATEEQLNERVPLSVASWHLHTNLCMPPVGQRKNADWSKFGLRGSITTQAACDAAGGVFHPVIFGWMTHVYPYESSLGEQFAMHHHD